ncbi:MAG: aminotransferase class III-fold pyridoxal phosphate-dependent enzyme, partial [Planctomycetota bacterium]
MTLRFAFLVHPLTRDTRQSSALGRELVEAGNSGFVNWVQTVHRAISQVRRGALSENGRRVQVVDELPGLVSTLGAKTHGRLYEIPMDALAVLDDPVGAVEHIEEAIRMAADWGARIVGLGSMTGVVGGQGQYVSERAPIPVTTGNSLTVYAAVENLLFACRESGVDLAEETAVVLGVPGSVASGAARLLSSECKSLVLVGRNRSSRALEIADELNAELLADVPEALRRAHLVFSATSSGQCIDQRWLQPGAIVSDVAVPADVRGTSAERRDVLILTGGLSRIPDTMPVSSDYLWFHQGMIPSCLAETMVLALENHTECYSIGRSLDVERIRRIGQMAEAHGFSFSRFYSFGLRLDDTKLIHFRKHVARRNRSRPRAAARAVPREGPPAPAELAARAGEWWRRYVNPVLMSVSGNGFIKTFVRGEGTRVWDHESNAYLDFVAGYGSLNLGHNHPRVVEAVQTALAERAPGFSPSAVNPYAAALADELVTISPGGLEMVCFSNSGTEAVEAALKLARASTGRTDFLYCERSYHGKSLGSLSVTGNPHYQRPFQPLLPGCTAIPYGDSAALERAL